MTDNDRKEAIKEVLKWVKSGKQDLQNGAEEIDTINYIYEQDKVKNLNIDDVRLSLPDDVELRATAWDYGQKVMGDSYAMKQADDAFRCGAKWIIDRVEPNEA